MKERGICPLEKMEVEEKKKCVFFFLMKDVSKRKQWISSIFFFPVLLLVFCFQIQVLFDYRAFLSCVT
jgi:hypothetical protein